MIENSLTLIKNKAITNIIKAFDGVTDTVFSWMGNIHQDLLTNKDVVKLHEKMCECISPTKGDEITARRNAIALGNLYLNLSKTGKYKFLQILVEKFNVNKEEILEKIKDYSENTDSNLEYKLEKQLITVLEAPRLKIIKRFISLPNGLKFVVDMRADIINFKKKDRFLSILEKDLKDILSSWFDVGLLDLCQITWNSSAALLEKLIAYEAVHAISSWDDLRNRLDSDRRCFAFFHHKILNEPLIFVEIALTNKIADSIQDLLNENNPTENPKNANTAIFYSISNTQIGLSGINLGNFLIKRVVEKLSEELKNIKYYATLSPIPGFVTWLKSKAKDEKVIQDIQLTTSIVEEYVNSIRNDLYTENVKNTLLKLCAYYLTQVKKYEKAYDSVAHFHLSNGAVIKKINWMADVSEKGLNQSLGMMTNYYYDLNKIDDNYESYVINKKVNYSKEVSSLLHISVKTIA